MRLTAEDYEESNESPTLLKDKEEHPEEEENKKELSPAAKKFKNFWYYNWIKVLVGVLGVTLATILIIDIIHANKPRILSVSVVNASSATYLAPLIDGLSTVYDYNRNKEVINFETSAFFTNDGSESSQATTLALRTNVASGDYDILIMDKVTADYFCEFIDICEDVASFLPEDVYTLYEDHLYTMTPADYHEITPGFYIEDNAILKETDMFFEDTPYVLLPIPNGQHYDNMVTFLKYIAQ